MSIKALHRFFWIVVTLWLTILFFHQLSADEAEHLHVAWLYESRGLFPFHDFFQHHTPVLWDILSLYYKFGGEGPEIIYYGRGLVVLSGIITVFGFYTLGNHKGRTQNDIALPGMLGILIFIFASTLMTNMFTIRAETVSFAAFTWSCVLWLKKSAQSTSKIYISDFLAGILFGLAILSSPRFLMLGGVFLLFNKNRSHLFVKDPARYVTLTFGTALCVISYIHFSYLSFLDFYHILAFSSFLQTIGDGKPIDESIIIFFAVALFFLYVVYRLDYSKQKFKYQWLSKSLYLLLLFLFAFVIAGKYRYSQDMTPLVFFICLLLIYYLPNLKNSLELKELAQGLTIAVCVFALTNHDHLILGKKLIQDDIKRIHHDFSLIPAGEKIFLFPRQHPITADDSSYYVRPLSDSKNRLCNAVDLYSPLKKSPECNYWKDIKNNPPYLLTLDILKIIPEMLDNQVKEFVDINYFKCDRFYVRLPYTQTECEAHEKLVSK